MTCIFCDLILPEQVLYETTHFRLVYDIDPIQTGHLLLMTKEHYLSLADLPRELLYEWIEIEADLVKLMESQLPISGVTVVTNDKDLMDKNTHLHRHFIPRKAGDGFWDKLAVPKEDWHLANLEKAIKFL